AARFIICNGPCRTPVPRSKSTPWRLRRTSRCPTLLPCCTSRAASMGCSGPPNIVKQRHEPVVHVQLLVAVQQSQSRIVGHKPNRRLLVAPQHHHVLENSSARLVSQAGEFKAVPVQMDGMDIVAGIAHTNAVTLP